jgi:hypothetical protein
MKTKTILLSLSLVLLLTTLVSNAAGQVTGQPYRVSDKEVAKLLDRIKKETNQFRKSLKDALNKGRLNGTSREDEINAYVKAFAEQTAQLEDHFDHHRSTAADVDAVLDRAGRIDGFMSRHSLSGGAQGDWSRLRADLERLALAYNVSWRWGGPLGSVGADLPYRLSDKEVEEIIHRIESQSDTFRKSLDTALDKSGLDGTPQEDEINAFVKTFYSETKKLHDHFDDHKSTTNDVQTVLDSAARIDSFMRRHRKLRSQAHKDWAKLRENLDDLARAYNVTWRWGFLDSE